MSVDKNSRRHFTESLEGSQYPLSHSEHHRPCCWAFAFLPSSTPIACPVLRGWGRASKGLF